MKPGLAAGGMLPCSALCGTAAKDRTWMPPTLNLTWLKYGNLSAESGEIGYAHICGRQSCNYLSNLQRYTPFDVVIPLLVNGLFYGHPGRYVENTKDKCNTL